MIEDILILLGIQEKEKMPANHECAFWMYDAVSRTKCDQAIAKAQDELRVVGTLTGAYFDSIAFSGISGDLFGPVLAYAMKKEIICVRKRAAGTTSHSDREVEGYAHSQRYIIVDDLVSSGSTIIRIVRAIKRLTPDAQCVGVYTYSNDGGGNITGFAGPGHKFFDAVMAAALEKEVVIDEKTLDQILMES